MSTSDLDTDVLVVGAGGCGLAAAVAAHDAGAQVAVVEKRETPGGNTAISTGSIPGAGTRFQRAAGIEDSAELFHADLMALSGPHDAEALTRRLAECSAALVEWLADDLGVTLDIITDYKHVGHSVPRLHAPASRKGADLTRDLVAAVERRGIPLAVASPVTSLETDASGAVVGAVVDGGRSGSYRVSARKTVIAVNGFGNDRALVARYCPEIAGASYVGALGSEGEAIRWGEALGSRFGNMASYQGYASIIHPHGELLSWTTIEKGGIFVNARGERFGDEVIGYSGFAGPVNRQEGPVHAIFDQRIRDVAAREPWFREVLDYGGARRAATVEEMAAATGLPVDALAATIASYNRAAAGAERDPHGRKDFAMAPLEAPFWHTEVQAALLSTQGGLAIETDGRVLSRDGGPIRNLFAGGGAVAGIAGRQGGVGYASGSGLLHAIGLGRLAGLAAAGELATR
ncbi:FAD-dependent oxidoreductase [Propylenella binzhouense]|uniref:FAD-binding protein n=1 Tax=Propylenella binzhouense TaxID=2555902 RepID=A0A964WRT4_9HYPH|nr:FAD-dependent oxidoreductase [Propylenella binzhouense]MYZ46249.1 FAD-binding protein [Propylenella binzhouense]